MLGRGQGAQSKRCKLAQADGRSPGLRACLHASKCRPTSTVQHQVLAELSHACDKKLVAAPAARGTLWPPWPARLQFARHFVASVASKTASAAACARHKRPRGCAMLPDHQIAQQLKCSSGGCSRSETLRSCARQLCSCCAAPPHPASKAAFCGWFAVHAATPQQLPRLQRYETLPSRLA